MDAAAAADSDEVEATRRHLETIIVDWAEQAATARHAEKPLYYYVRTKQFDRLLRNFGELGAGWQTMQSMRSVDQECAIEVAGARHA